MKNHAEMIVEYFHYLVEDFGFSITQQEYDPITMGNAVVVFASNTIGIEVVIDRDQALISVGDIADRRYVWFEFFDVVNYYTHEKCKSYIFPEKTPDNTWDELVDAQLKRLSVILKEDCLPLLEGATLNKPEIQKIQNSRAAELRRKFNLPP